MNCIPKIFESIITNKLSNLSSHADENSIHHVFWVICCGNKNRTPFRIQLCAIFFLTVLWSIFNSWLMIRLNGPNKNQQKNFRNVKCHLSNEHKSEFV